MDLPGRAASISTHTDKPIHSAAASTWIMIAAVA
jgi:hypothetical protein